MLDVFEENPVTTARVGRDVFLCLLTCAAKEGYLNTSWGEKCVRSVAQDPKKKRITMKINAKYVCALLAVFSVKHISCDSLPCDFIDSINITDGIRDVLGNIVHNNILYKPKYYRTIDYDYEDFSTKKFVNEYIRGCPCAVRLCVRMCCPEGTVMYDYQCLSTTNKLEVLVNTTLFNVQRSFEVVDLTENNMYGFLYGKPCESVYELNRADDIWSFARVS